MSDAEKLAEEATPENINLAKSDVTTAQGDVASKEVALNNAKQTQADSESKVASQEGVVAEKETAVDTAKQEVKSAQSDVDTAQKLLDGTGASEIIAKAEQTQAQQDKDQKAVDTAQSALDKAKQADSDRQNAIDKAQKDLNDAQSALDSAKDKVKETATKAEETANILSTSQEKYDVAEQAYNQVNTLTLSEDYVKYMNIAYGNEIVGGDWKTGYIWKYTDEEVKDADTKLLSLGTQESKNNHYKTNKADQERKIDINNLTDKEKTELALFAADLSNQVRKQIGSDPVDVTVSSVQLGWDQASYYSSKFSSIWDMYHDTKSVEEKYGLKWIDEDLAGNYIKITTMDDAKRAIYKAYTQWLFATDESLHASSVAGVRNETKGAKNHISIGISQYPDGSIIVNYNNTDSAHIPSDNIIFDTTVIEDKSPSYGTLFENYTKAKEALEKSITANAEAQNQKKVAEQNQQLAQSKLDATKQVLASATSTSIQTPAAQSKFDEATKALAESIEENKKAQQAVDDLNADIKVKQAKLDEAKKVLADKEKALANAENALSQERSTLASLKADVEKAKVGVSNAQNELAEAMETLKVKQDRVSDLENAPQRLADAKTRLEKAQADLEEATKNAETSKERLDELVAIRNEKKAIYEELLSRYTAQQKRAEAERILKEAEERLRVQQMSSRQPAGYFSRVEANMGTNQADLPSTGDESTSAVAMLGMGLLSLLGVSVVGQRRRGKHSK